ncbi:hypothetical protein HCU40_16225 [Pseudanabaena biceps]|nr:hypothetical protein [Pseudanabaena biceps]
MIETCFIEIEQTIREFPNVRFVSLTKKIYNATQGYVGGSIIFENNHCLDFVEVKNTDFQQKLKYRYHYMNENQVMIFRYDNAPHHAEVSTFPHHKHEGDDVGETPEVSLYQVLLEITQRQR